MLFLDLIAFSNDCYLHFELPGFIIFLAIIWVLQETTKIHILRYIILFIGVMNSLFSVYDIYDDLISRRVNSSDAEKFAEVCPCPCNGVAWGVIWGMISFIFLCGALYLGLVILSWGLWMWVHIIVDTPKRAENHELFYSILWHNQDINRGFIIFIILYNTTWGGVVLRH